MQRLASWWWVLLPAVAALELSALARTDAQVTPEADWKAAARVVATEYRPGDLVVIAPEWVAQVARVHLGERLQPLEDVARADTSRFGRLWVVSIRGDTAPEEARAVLEKTWKKGLVTVRRLRLPPPARIAFDFVRDLDKATVTLVGDEERACPWNRLGTGIGGGRFRCSPRHDWQRVGVEVLDDLHRRPHLGIWAHPIRDQRIRIDFADVPLAEVLTGHMGLRYEACKTLDHGPVDFTVQVGVGRPRAFRERDADGWQPFTVATPRRSGQRDRVRFEVSAPDPGMRHFYFAADTRWRR